MNIEALRRTQRSIMDEVMPFNMGSWQSCIAGHALLAHGIPIERVYEESGFTTYMELLLGISHDQAVVLFRSSDMSMEDAVDRGLAVQRIDDLIGAHVRTAKAPERRLNSAETSETSETTEREPELVGA